MQVVDVVCHMTVDSETAIRREYQGQAYYFCAEGCARAFEQNPEAYLGQEGGHGGHHHHHHHGMHHSE
ncbi:YHS domain-containing protein [Candidatus Hydrogenisulfobacillus filiaventi]|uniref:YHS domain-containing protein n=1 Tax=Candidatus Hydrogenisulfobacillus filiaventi TaxID=2707344 RepID=A0A6F8ZE58_9FIRM|nr:YHS domain-containing protein [Bacillota bacterium]CAB1127742.1 YHS domain-containing protein [Candidatus Hydrogenisulfobacillus filiaventi]